MVNVSWMVALLCSGLIKENDMQIDTYKGLPEPKVRRLLGDAMQEAGTLTISDSIDYYENIVKNVEAYKLQQQKEWLKLLLKHRDWEIFSDYVSGGAHATFVGTRAEHNAYVKRLKRQGLLYTGDIADKPTEAAVWSQDTLLDEVYSALDALGDTEKVAIIAAKILKKAVTINTQGDYVIKELETDSMHTIQEDNLPIEVALEKLLDEYSEETCMRNTRKCDCGLCKYYKALENFKEQRRVFVLQVDDDGAVLSESCKVDDIQEGINCARGCSCGTDEEISVFVGREVYNTSYVEMEVVNESTDVA